MSAYGSIRRTRTQGPLWAKMNARPREFACELTRERISDKPGVYAWYHRGQPIYVGKAAELRSRLGRHLSCGASMASSAFRRNVAEHLGIGRPGDIKSGAYTLTDPERARVRAFIEECEVTWVECASAGEALRFDGHMKDEWLPPLTKR